MRPPQCVTRCVLLSLLSVPVPYACAQTSKAPNASPLIRQETQLPPFTLWAADGTTIDNAHLNPGGFWLMLYRDLSSSRGDEALGMLASLTAPAVATDAPSNGTAALKLDPARLVIVLEHATGAQVSQLQLNHPLLAGSIWLRDEKGVAAEAIGLHGSPHLIGMHESARRWQLAGSLEEPETKTAILSWVQHNSLPQNKLTRHKVKPAPPPAKTAAQAEAAAAMGHHGGSH